MKDNLKGVGIGSDDDEFGDASIECLGGLVGALLDLLQRGALGNQVEQLGGKLLGCEGLGSFGDGLNRIGLTILLKKIIFAIIKIRQLIACLGRVGKKCQEICKSIISVVISHFKP